VVAPSEGGRGVLPNSESVAAVAPQATGYSRTLLLGGKPAWLFAVIGCT